MERSCRDNWYERGRRKRREWWCGGGSCEGAREVKWHGRPAAAAGAVTGLQAPVVRSERREEGEDVVVVVLMVAEEEWVTMDIHSEND